jgi:hypothetical protein
MAPDSPAHNAVDPPVDETADSVVHLSKTEGTEEPQKERKQEVPFLSSDLPESIDLPEQSEPLPVEVSEIDPKWGESSSVWQKIEEIVSKHPSDDEILSLVQHWESVLSTDRLPMLRFANDVTSSPARFIAVPALESINCLWFIGDVHGDILGLETAIEYITTKDPEPTICFLGDLFDRGYRHGSVLFRFMQLVNDKPGKVAFVVGNHDEGLSYDDDTQTFWSSVRPSEASDWLNEEAMDSPWRKLARIAIPFFERAPRAILLPDGLLVAHGGVPHVDLQEKLNSTSDLENADLLEDFVWTRLHETAKKRIPNRSTRGCSLGIDDFDNFCSRLHNVLGRPVQRMIRGHDHLEFRFAQFPRYRKHPVLTINTMCHRLSSEMPGTFQMPLIIAKYEAGQLPRIHRLRIPRHVLDAIYPKDPGGIEREGSRDESR